MQATRLRKGMLIKSGQDLLRVLELQHVTPGNLRGFVRVKFRNIRTNALADQKLRSEDEIERATLDEKSMQYLYHDGSTYHFMDTESYEQSELSAEFVGDAAKWLKENEVATIQFAGGEMIAVEPPMFVELEVVETDPGFKGDTVQGGSKSARLETGAVVQVPMFINNGDRVRIDTRDAHYVTRV